MKTHGMTNTRAYRIWCGMIARCRNKNVSAYNLYGGRGISVCDRWNDFSSFIDDMGEPPQGASLDRIDVNGDYHPENCRWADHATQNRNRRDNVRVTVAGDSVVLLDACARLGLPYHTVIARLRRGWDMDRALSEPVRPSTPSGIRKKGGESLAATCRRVGADYASTYRYHVKLGFPLDEALRLSARAA